MKNVQFCTIMLLVFISLAAATAHAAETKNKNDICAESCASFFGSNYGGSCKGLWDPVASDTKLVTGKQMCDSGESCYCAIVPSAACSRACRGTYNWSGVCAPQQNCIGGVGTVGGARPLTAVSCGTGTTAAEPICCCMQADPKTQSEIDSLSAVLIWPMEKACTPVGGTDYYSVQLRGIWSGGQALRIDVYGSGTQIAPATGTGVPSALLHGAGWYADSRRIPRPVVAANNNLLTVRYTIIPYQNQMLVNMYLQSLVSQTPYAQYSTSGYVPGVQTYYPQQGNYFVEDVIACEETPIPAPSVPTPLIEGPAPIDIESITCTPAAGPYNPTTGRSYQNPWHLVDLDAESWFQFAPPLTAVAPTPTGPVAVEIPTGGTGTPGTTPTFSATAAATEEAFTSFYPSAAFAQAATYPGSCTIKLKEWTLSGGMKKTPEIYGIDLYTWSQDSDRDNIEISQIRVGSTQVNINSTNAYLTNGSTGTTSYWQKTYALADQGVNVPLKGREVVIYFNYTGTPVLRELNLWPTLARVNISTYNTVALAGTPVTLEGNVTLQEWINDGGNIAHCVYQWNGSCIACAGTGCHSSDKKYPGIGKPIWALIPMPRSWMNFLQSIFGGFGQVTGLRVSPPKLTIPMPTLVFDQKPDEKAEQAAEKGVSEDIQKQVDEKNKDAATKLDEANKAVAPTVSSVGNAYTQILNSRVNVEAALQSAKSAKRYIDTVLESSEMKDKILKSDDYTDTQSKLAAAITALETAKSKAQDAEIAGKAAMKKANELESAIQSQPDRVMQLGSELQAKINDAKEKTKTAKSARLDAWLIAIDVGTAAGKLSSVVTNLSTETKIAIETAKSLITSAKSSIAAAEIASNPFDLEIKGLQTAQQNALDASVARQVAANLDSSRSTTNLFSRLGLRLDTIISAILVGKVHQWITNQPGAQDKNLQLWFGLGYMLAMNEALKNAATQCYEAFEIPIIKVKVRFCSIDFFVFTWWSPVSSVREPDPDGAGDYVLEVSTCRKGTPFDTFMANAGMWAFLSPIADALSNMTIEAENARIESINNELKEVPSCDACTNGFQRGAVQLTAEQKADLIKECTDKFDGDAYKVCVEVSGRTARSVAQGESCGANELTIYTNDSCSSQITSALGRQGDRINGKWCAKKISINYSESEALYKERLGEPVERVQVNDSTALYRFGDVAKCVLESDSCPTGMDELADCSKGNTSSQVAAAMKELAAKGIKKCEACEKAGYKWCAEFVVENGKIGDMRGACIAKDTDCQEPKKIMSCAKYNSYVTAFVKAPPPPPPTGVDECRRIVDWYKDSPDGAKIGFCYDRSAPSGGRAAYTTDCTSPKIFIESGNIDECDKWDKLRRLGGLDGILRRAQDLKEQIDGEITLIKKVPVEKRTNDQNNRLSQLEQHAARLNTIIDTITKKKVEGIKAELDELGEWEKDINAMEGASGREELSVPLAPTVTEFTVLDKAAPTVTEFRVPETASTLTVTGITIEASGGTGVTGYLITETSMKPAATERGWSTTAPTRYTFTTAGAKTLYAWAKDASGKISESKSATVTIQVPRTEWKIDIINENDFEDNCDELKLRVLISHGELGIYAFLLSTSIAGGYVGEPVTLDVKNLPYFSPILTYDQDMLGLECSTKSLTGTGNVVGYLRLPNRTMSTTPVSGNLDFFIASCIPFFRGDRCRIDTFPTVTAGAVLSEKLEIPPSSEPGTAPMFGSLPVTGAATRPSSSFGPISTRGEAGDILGISGSSGQIKAFELLAKSQQTKFLIQLLEALKSGETIYRRQYVVQPSLGEGSLAKCKSQPADAVFGLKKATNAPYGIGSPAVLVDTVIETWQYLTMENEPEPPRSSTPANVTITIYNNTGGIVHAESMPANSSGFDGYFVTSWTPPLRNTTETYTVEAKTGGVVSPGRLTFTAVPHPTPFFSVAPNVVCTKPGVPQSAVGLTIKEYDGPLAATDYNLTVCRYASLTGGNCMADVQIGLPTFDANGNPILSSSMALSMQANNSISSVISSNVSTTTLIGVRLQNAQFGIDEHRNFTHITVTDPKIDLVSMNPITSQQAFVENIFRFNLTNQIPGGCTPTAFALVAEPPSLGGWSIIVNDSVEVQGGNSTEIEMGVTPIEPPGMGAWPTYILATSSRPTQLGTGDVAIALAADNRYAYYTSAGKLKQINLLSNQVMGAGNSIGSDAGGVAVDNDRIYFAAGGAISRTMKDAWSPVIVARGVVTGGSQLAVDSTYVWWLEQFEAGARIKRAEKTANAADCSGSNCVFAIVPATDIAVDATYVYWTEPDGTIKRMPKTVGSTVAQFVNKRATTLTWDSTGFYAGIGDELGSSKVVRIIGNGTADEPLSAYPSRDYAYAIGRNVATDIAIGAKLVWIEGGSIFGVDRDALTDWEVVWYEYCAECAPIVTIVPQNAPAGTQAALAPAGETATYVINITNTAGVAVYGWELGMTTPPEGWTAELSNDFVDLEAAGLPEDSVAIYAYVTSPEDATGSWAFTVSASKLGVVGSASSSYVISEHMRPSITAALINPADAVARPGDAVGWNLAVRNNDPLEFAIPADIELSIVESSVPADWDAWFQVGDDPDRYESVTLSTFPSSANNSARFYAQSLRSSADGTYTLWLRASIEGLENTTSIFYNIVGCGNGVCEPERGEYDKASSKWCAADCLQGWDNFKCTYAGQSPVRTWLECDKTRENSTDFGLELVIPDYAQLTNRMLRVCRRNSTVDACAAATTCGLTKVGTAAALSSACVADLSASLGGAQGPPWSGKLACPADYGTDYYLLFRGITTTIINLTPVRTMQNWTSANFSFSCPDYRLGEIGIAYQTWQGLYGNCIGERDYLAQSLGFESACTQKMNQICMMREQHMQDLSVVISNPTATSASQTRNATASLERQIAAILAANCFNIPVLEIISIQPPSTFVGEISPITIQMNNTQDVRYRGYATCALRLPNGAQRTERSGCMLFNASSMTDVTVPVALTMEGNWTIESCSVFSDVETAVATDCSNAPQLFAKAANVPFAVGPAIALFISPVADSNLSATVPIVAEVGGEWSSVSWSYSSTSSTCSDGAVVGLTASAGLPRNWTGSWNTTAVADKSYYLCIRGMLAGNTAHIASINVSVDNHRFTLNPAEAELNVATHEVKTSTLTLRNTGVADQYVLTCSAPAGWSASLSSGTSTAACGQSLIINLNTGASMEVTMSTTVPVLPIGTQSAIEITAANSQGEIVNVEQILRISEVSNDAPTVTDMSTQPTSVQPGATVTFRAVVDDPNGDAITTADACADADCNTPYCSLQPAPTASQPKLRSCSAAVSTAGTRTWWTRATDALGLSASYEGSEFTVVGPVPITAQSCSALGAAYGCFASCEPNPAYCANRTSYGVLDCGPGLVCCKEIPIPNCEPPVECTIQIDSKSCIWDPVALNYSVSAQASWSGGTYARISAASVTSGPIFAKPAVFNSRSATGGSKGITAAVYSSTDATLCTSTSTVTCVTPDQLPPASPRTGALTVVLATASTFTIGNEAGKAADRDQFTAWQAQPGVPQWLKLDLGSLKTINGIGIYSTSGRPRNFVIDISINDQTWSRVATVRNAMYNNDWNLTQFSAVDARYVRLNVTAADAAVLAYEVEVYPGVIGLAPPTGAPPSEFPWAIIIIVIVVAVVAILLLLNRTRISLGWSYVRG